MNVDMKIVKEIEKINFFEKCGHREKLLLNHSYRMIRSLDTIDDESLIYSWANTCQRSMNDISSYLHDNYEDIVNHEWNPLVDDIDRDIMPNINDEIYSKCSGTNFGDRDELVRSIVHNIKQIIMASSMKEYYKSDFFEDLFTIYKAGHIACGWIGSQYYGKFKVY